MGTTVIIHLTDEQAAELESMAEETRVSVAKAVKRPSPAISQPDGEPNDQKDKLLTRSDGQRGSGITWPSGGRKKSSPRTSSPGGRPCRAPGPRFVQDPEPAIVKRRQQPRGESEGAVGRKHTSVLGLFRFTPVHVSRDGRRGAHPP